jgi:hypothetical protein
VKRRDFLTRGTAAAGLAGSTALLKPLEAAQSAAAKPAQSAAKAQSAHEEIPGIKRAHTGLADAVG